MKIKKTSIDRSSLISLTFLQTKNCFSYSSKLKDMQLLLIKGLKIIYKYNACDKKIVFINAWPIITTAIRYLIDKSKHKYLSSIRRILTNKQDSVHEKDLLVLLGTKISRHFKIPSVWIGNHFNSGTSYNIVGDFLFKTNNYFLLFLFLQSIIRRLFYLKQSAWRSYFLNYLKKIDLTWL